MPIPTPTENEMLCDEVRRYLEMGSITLPPDWSVEVEVRPYLGFDIRWEIQAEKKTIYFLVYSARYPQTWVNWIKDCIIELLLPLYKAIGDDEDD